MIGWIEDCQRRGLRIFGQGQTVRATYYFNLDGWNLYDSSPAWRDATTGTLEEKIRKLSDPELRARMIGDVDSGKLSTMTVGGDMGEHIYQGAPNCPEHDDLIGLTLHQIAERRGKHRAEVMIDLSIESDLQGTFLTMSVTCVNADDIEEILACPYVFPGVPDGGAHTKFLTTGSFTTDTIAWMVRHEGRMTLEQAHYKLSYLPAHAAGFKGRGFLREGAPADIVVYELDRLAQLPSWNDSEVVYDLPGGEWRRIQRAQGYRWIMVNGEITFENDVCTNATPGRLLRHGLG